MRDREFWVTPAVGVTLVITAVMDILAVVDTLAALVTPAVVAMWAVRDTLDQWEQWAPGVILDT
jgi:hypothetical protein